MPTVKELLQQKEVFKKEIADRHKYVTQEYQDYGYRLAVKLDDLAHKALYIKLAKEKNRVLLEKAYSFAIDYPNAKNRGKLFMWKIKELTDQIGKTSTNAKILKDGISEAKNFTKSK